MPKKIGLLADIVATAMNHSGWITNPQDSATRSEVWIRRLESKQQPREYSSNDTEGSLVRTNVGGVLNTFEIGGWWSIDGVLNLYTRRNICHFRYWTWPQSCIFVRQVDDNVWCTAWSRECWWCDDSNCAHCARHHEVTVVGLPAKNLKWHHCQLMRIAP